MAITIRDAMLVHADKYGTAGVAETAVDLGFEAEELADLLVELDKIHRRQLDDKKERARLGLKGIAPVYRKTTLERAEKLIEELRQ